MIDILEPNADSQRYDERLRLARAGLRTVLDVEQRGFDADLARLRATPSEGRTDRGRSWRGRS